MLNLLTHMVNKMFPDVASDERTPSWQGQEREQQPVVLQDHLQQQLLDLQRRQQQQEQHQQVCTATCFLIWSNCSQIRLETGSCLERLQALRLLKCRVVTDHQRF